MNTPVASFEGMHRHFMDMPSEDIQMTVLFCHLLLVARKAKHTNYRTPAQAMLLFSAAIGGHLESLFDLHRKYGTPLFGALVVNKESQIPSEGFFDAAVRYGYLNADATSECKMAFWKDQVDLVFSSQKSLDLKDFVGGLSQHQINALKKILSMQTS